MFSPFIMMILRAKTDRDDRQRHRERQRKRHLTLKDDLNLVFFVETASSNEHFALLFHLFFLVLSSSSCVVIGRNTTFLLLPLFFFCLFLVSSSSLFFLSPLPLLTPSSLASSTHHSFCCRVSIPFFVLFSHVFLSCVKQRIPMNHVFLRLMFLSFLYMGLSWSWTLIIMKTFTKCLEVLHEYSLCLCRDSAFDCKIKLRNIIIIIL